MGRVEKKNFKRVVVLADLHCGHRVGLTPPDWQSDAPGGKYLLIQQQLWEAYAGWIEQAKPIDYLFVNGDSIDGKGDRSGGTELITSDREKQCRMAHDAITICEVPGHNIVMTKGTGYHVGNDEDWEEILSEYLDAKACKSHEWPSIDGIVFDLKHQPAGSTNVAYNSVIGKDKLSNVIWEEYNAQPKAQVIIRSHLHRASSVCEPLWVGILTPALQGAGTKFGARRCSMRVDFGITVIDIHQGESLQERVKWEWKTKFVESQKSGVLEL